MSPKWIKWDDLMANRRLLSFFKSYIFYNYFLQKCHFQMDETYSLEGEGAAKENSDISVKLSPCHFKTDYINSISCV